MQNGNFTLGHRLLITAGVTFLVWSHLAWDYFHGGIPTHYLLHDPNLPGIPNWLGALVLPFFTWFLLYRIHKRISGPNSEDRLQTILYRFVAAVLVAISIAVSFTYGIEIIDYIMGALFILAFFKPLYKSEYLLGFVLGATFTFGGMIPMGFGSVLALLFFMFYTIGRILLGLLRSK